MSGPVSGITDAVVSRFMDKVHPDPNTGCWLWGSAHSERGYARFSLRGRNRAAHRVAYRIFVGPVRGLNVLHRCDNRGCVNPDHLFLGTQADNVRDMIEKGRQSYARGSDNHNAALVEGDVRDIRRRAKAGETYKDLGAEYGINCDYVGQIVRRRWWRHV